MLRRYNHILPYKRSGPGSVVNTATGYGLDGPGIESRWLARFSAPVQTGLLYNGYRVFPGGKERPGRDADPSPLLVPWSWTGRAIPLLPLWAVRPVQSLSACRRVHFTFYLTLQTQITHNAYAYSLGPVRLRSSVPDPSRTSAILSSQHIVRYLSWYSEGSLLCAWETCFPHLVTEMPKLIWRQPTTGVSKFRA